MTTFRLATESDDAILRSLLRGNPMPTWVDMAIEREPSFFAGKDMLGNDWAVIAEDDDEVVGMYTASVMPVHVDGRAELLGYLGGLRVNPGFRRKIRYLRDGYASIRKLAPTTGTLPWWFTVVASENTTARRLLESGVGGLPSYKYQGDYVTFAVATAHGKRRNLWRAATVTDIPHIVNFYNEQARRFQCSPVLSAALIGQIGIHAFFIYEHSGVAALWDQRAFKQVVARHYRRPLRTLRPFYNLYAKALRKIPLPPEGGALDQTFIAFLALDTATQHRASDLLRDLLSHCRTRAASIGLYAENPLIPMIKTMKPISYPARVYAVCFDGEAVPNGRPMQPEAALL
ncbi:MAG: hypothetical protein QOK37_2557 [Thermoanaerobaculia bacterium]|jgi:hypothetical protein|nr:hypothetical protein [Thermoanaerobaculia bacterium]